MKTIKILYTEDGKLLYSKFFPEVPEVKASIYQDTMAMNRFNSQMEEAVRKAIPVMNPDKALAHIAFNERVERDKVYAITCDFHIHSNAEGYQIEIL